jgi:hypothetical protein
VLTPPSDAQSTGYGMWLGAPVQFVSLGAMTDDERLAFYAETRLRMYVRAGRGIAAWGLKCSPCLDSCAKNVLATRSIAQPVLANHSLGGCTTPTSTPWSALSWRRPRSS